MTYKVDVSRLDTQNVCVSTLKHTQFVCQNVSTYRIYVCQHVSIQSLCVTTHVCFESSKVIICLSSHRMAGFIPIHEISGVRFVDSSQQIDHPLLNWNETPIKLYFVIKLVLSN